MPLSEHVYCVTIAFKMTEWVEQQIFTKFCAVNIRPWKLLRGFRRPQLWQLVIGSFITTMHLLMHHISCRVFWQNIKSPSGFSSPPDLAPCDFLLFPKLQSPLKGERFQTTNEIDRAADGNSNTGLCRVFWAGQRHSENCVRSQDTYLEDDWDAIALCTMFLVSFIFFHKCLYFS